MILLALSQSEKIFINSTVLVLLTVFLGFLASLFWWLKNQAVTKAAAIAKGHEDLVSQVQSMATQLAVMNQTVSPLFEATKLKLIETLIHPHPEFKIPDELLEEAKGPNGRMGKRLRAILKERETSTHPDVTPEEKLAAYVLPVIFEIATIEKETIEKLGPLSHQVVSSPVATNADIAKTTIWVGLSAMIAHLWK